MTGLVSFVTLLPVVAPLLEAGVEPVRLRLEKRSLLLREKYKRQKPSDPRRQMLEEEKTVRLKTRTEATSAALEGNQVSV